LNNNLKVKVRLHTKTKKKNMTMRAKGVKSEVGLKYDDVLTLKLSLAVAF
jgi:hypothetical protein